MAHSKGPLLEQDVTLSQEDFNRFAAISGDHNPIHVDPGYAADTRFGATVSHGMLLFSLVRALIAKSWPGATLDVQALKFPAPAYADEPLTVSLTPREANDGLGDALELDTLVIKKDGRLCLEGRARIQAHQEVTP